MKELSINEIYKQLKVLIPNSDKVVNDLFDTFNQDEYQDIINKTGSDIEQISKGIDLLNITEEQKKAAKFIFVKMLCDQGEKECLLRSSSLMWDEIQLSKKEYNELARHYNHLVEEHKKVKLKDEIDLSNIIANVHISNGIVTDNDRRKIIANAPKMLNNMRLNDKKIRLSVNKIRDNTGADLQGTTHAYIDNLGISNKGKSIVHVSSR